MDQFMSYDIAPFLACINMLKINTRPEVFKMLIAVLCDFIPNDHNNRLRTIRYVKLLLEDQEDLADCVITFLPATGADNAVLPEPKSAVTGTSRLTPHQDGEEVTNTKTKTKTKAGQLLAQATANRKLKSTTKPSTSKTATGQSSGKSDSVKTVVVKTRTPVVIKQKTTTRTQSESKSSSSNPSPVISSNPVLASVLQTSSVHTSTHGNIHPVVSKNQLLSLNSNILNKGQFQGQALLRDNQECQNNTPSSSTSNTKSKPPDQTYTVPPPPYPYVLGQRGPFITPGNNYYYGFSGFPFPRPNLAPPSVRSVYLQGVAPYSTTMPVNTPRLPVHNGVSDIPHESYLTAHTIEKRLTGPESIAPYIRTKPTCIVKPNEDNLSPVSKKSSSKPKTHKSFRAVTSTTIQKQTDPDPQRPNAGLPLPTATPDPSTQQQPHAIVLNTINSPSSTSNPNTTISRNLTSFPYIQKMTLLDGQTQHLRIQGSGNIGSYRRLSESSSPANPGNQQVVVDLKQSGVRRNTSVQCNRTKQAKRKRDNSTRTSPLIPKKSALSTDHESS
ncbi:uncharacterized protein LOC126817513 [Patella vulgata]|uniref:uncharacterized protein LOC126817513 n=1 Tax=Patella vulgata TaxID=6465 RepID=UPI00217F738A|nr:uncharacterized protein LOC126817513 [Patella vulgata]